MDASKPAVYPVAGPGAEQPPNFSVRSLSDEELEDEILGRKGGPEYQAALVAEADRRSKAGAPPEPPRRSGAFDVAEWD